MKSLNLSEWALNHRSLVVYLMIVAVAAGVLSYFRLGRDEDPSFVIKTMVVKAVWPGATTEDTLNQSHREAGAHAGGDPASRLPPQLYHDRRHHDLRQPEGQHLGQAGRRHLVSRAQEHRRYAAHVAVRRAAGPSSMMSSATRSGSSTGSPLTALRRASSATTSRTFARNCSVCRTSPRSRSLGAQDEQIFIEFSMQELATSRHRPRRIDRRSAGAEYRQTRPA